MMKTGVILANLGTPTAPTSKAIRRFLRPFLQDKRVIQDVPAWLWRCILESVILPFRPAKIRHNYEKIWTSEGSPLLVYSRQQAQALAKVLASENIAVSLAMTYGEPSFKSALHALQSAGCERVMVIPLYPQYSSTTTAAVFDGLARALAQQYVLPELVFIKDYYRHPLYSQALSLSIANHWQQHGRGDARRRALPGRFRRPALCRHGALAAAFLRRTGNDLRLSRRLPYRHGPYGA